MVYDSDLLYSDGDTPLYRRKEVEKYLYPVYPDIQAISVKETRPEDIMSIAYIIRS